MGLSQGNSAPSSPVRAGAEVAAASDEDDSSDAIEGNERQPRASVSSPEAVDWGLLGPQDTRAETDWEDPELAADDVDLYVDAWGRHIAWDGVRPQLQAMLDGMSDVMSIPAIPLLQAHEMVRILCGSSTVHWTLQDLEEHVKARPPYFTSSSVVKNVRELMMEMSQPQRRAFLQFATGSPILPPGGLAALDPPLTVGAKELP